MRDVTLPLTTPSVDDLEAHRRELTGYCYRMLGAGAEAEDAVQETMLRAWRAAHTVEGRASGRPWPHRLATHGRLDKGRRPPRGQLGPPRPRRVGDRPLR